MNASTQSLTGGSADSEITAELPVLDVAAYEARQGQDPLASTDTWSSPALSTAIMPQPANLPPELVEQALPANVSAKLETELRSLASNLTELETRLAAKGERLAIIEAELADSRVAGQAAAARAAALSDELTGSRAAVAAATTQIEGLQSKIEEREAAIQAAAEQMAELRKAQERREAEIASSIAATEARAAAQVAAHENVASAARQHAAQLQAQGAAQLEALQSLEGRRGVFDSMLRALDTQLMGRDQDHLRLDGELARSNARVQEQQRELEARTQRITQLEAEVAMLTSHLGARTDEAGAIARTNHELTQTVEGLREESSGRATRIAQLEAQLNSDNHVHAEALRAAATAHADLAGANKALLGEKAQLESEVATLRTESAGHLANLQQVTAESAERLGQIEALDAQTASLTAQIEVQARSIAADAERLRLTEERLSVAENDLRVAEEAINRLESEVRTRSMRVEELTRINSQMQTDIADAKRWLDERDSLMQRLESEAAHSAALVDNIQRTIRSLAPGASGTHEVVRETAAARLLVRSQDGREVVHVLGRKTTIGRTPDNDLQIEASFVSRHHAVLLMSGQQTVIEDLNSTNGVLVNGQRITRQALNDGDQVAIGKARFRFVIRAVGARSSAEPAA